MSNPNELADALLPPFPIEYLARQHRERAIKREGSGPYWCRCGASIRHPGICEHCAEQMMREEQRDTIREKVRANMPAAYRRLTLDRMTELSQSTLCGISEGKTLAARHFLAGDSATGIGPRTLLIRGGTHKLKSTFAGAIAREWIERGNEATFIGAHLFAPETLPEERAQAVRYANDGGRLVVIDDIASVLANAPIDGGVASQRMATMLHVMRTRHNNNWRTIYTYAGPLDAKELVNGKNGIPGIREIFGDDIFARLTDPKEALIINLDKP